MEKIEIIKGNCPSKSNCYKIISQYIRGRKKASIGKTTKLKEFEASFLDQCKIYKDMNIEGEFKFQALVYYDSKRPDLDNAFKVILDCLQKLKAVKNDNKCVRIDALKFKDTNYPRIEFKLIPVEKWNYSGGWEMM